MIEHDPKRRVLNDLFEETIATGRFPSAHGFRIRHEAQRPLIDELDRERLITQTHVYYRLTLKGLRSLDSDAARIELESIGSLIPYLQEMWRQESASRSNTQQLSDRTGKPRPEVARLLTYLSDTGIFGGTNTSNDGLISDFSLVEGILDISPIDLIGLPPDLLQEIEKPSRPPVLSRIRIEGYRPFGKFAADLGQLTVVIGANGTGKSSFFDFLQFIRGAVAAPLPPEIDPRSVGKQLFHDRSRERLAFGLTLKYGGRGALEYDVEILGPVGRPRVASESLRTASLSESAGVAPFIFLDMRGGRGIVRDPRAPAMSTPSLNLQVNELAIRRALDPSLTTLARVYESLLAWRLYDGFDLSPSAPIRRPDIVQSSRFLEPSGANLTGVLSELRQRQHIDLWDELEGHIRSVIPGFKYLDVRPTAAPGTLLGYWSEQGVDHELTFADLSDGTLSILCWSALCLGPRVPTLMCIDEPENGLHPRALSTLAGLFRLASTRCQIVIATHSPYFLSHFNLEEIAVMRKENGEAVFLRPQSRDALRKMVEELGQAGIERLHLSDELEALP